MTPDVQTDRTPGVECSAFGGGLIRLSTDWKWSIPSAYTDETTLAKKESGNAP
jgi:hypothetical protein